MSQSTNEHTISRRAILSGLVPAAIVAGNGPVWSQSSPPEERNGQFPGLITREKEPMNLEFPFPTLASRITPTNQFYVRSHFPIPKLEAASWQLTIEGEVNKPFTISYAELRALPAKTVMATLECAGNGRAGLVPKAKGLLWEEGGVGNAEWKGVPLSTLLDRAGVKADAVEIILEGADQGEITEEPKSPGTIKFARSLPLTKARQADVLIAYQMNGKDLTAPHGFPVRAIIPGWYGMASVKWLTKLTLINRPYDGYWQTMEYAYWQRKNGLPTLTPVRETQVKAQIARPALNEIIPAGKAYRLFGAAWTGESSLTKVEVSTDGGKTYQAANLLDKAVPYAWQLWEYNWPVPTQAGRHTLLVKATDAKGNTQPTTHDPDRRTYMINKLSPLEVDVQ